MGHRHQRVDGEVGPEREQRPVHLQVGVVGGDEQDRAGLLLAGDPCLDREGVAVVAEEAEDLRVGVEHGPDRLRHACRFRGGEGVGNRLLEVAVDLLQVGRHQVLGERSVRGLLLLDELHAHLDEQGTGGERPERLGGTSVGWDQCCCGSGELAVGLAVVEDRPGRAAIVHRVEDRVAVGVVERLDIGPGQVEHDGAVLALAHLRDVAAQRSGLARAGRADQHGMGLLQPVRVGDAGERVGVVDAACLARAERHLQHRFRGAVGEEAAGFLLELRSVVLDDLLVEHVALDQHGAALVPFLDHRLPAAGGEIDVPDGHRDGCEGGDQRRADDAANRLVPGGNDLGHIGHVADDRAVQAAVRHTEVDLLEGIEGDPVPDAR